MNLFGLSDMDWKRFKKFLIYKFKDFTGLNFKNSYKKYYSQYGEDITVQSLFKKHDFSKITSLDIGCNHPFRFNNTALLYLNRASGYYIDANPIFMSDFQKHRSRDTFFNMGIADRNGSLNFYLMNNSKLSTFSEEEYSNYIPMGYTLKQTLKVPVIRLDLFISTHCNRVFPDSLSLDVEGQDLEILYSYD